MHLFSPDGSRLTLLDAHGLTQITFPSKVKTDKNVAAGGNSLLSQDETGEQLLAYDGIEGRVTLFDATLTATRRLKHAQLENSSLLPDGQHVVLWDVERDESDEWVKLLAIHRLDGKQLWKGRLASLPARELPARTLGPDCRGHTDATIHLACSRSGTFVMWERGVLYAGEIKSPSKGPKLFWKMRLRAPTRPLFFSAGQQTVTVVALDTSLARAFIALIDAEGAVRAVEVPAIATPVVDGHRVVFQQDESTVARMDLTTGKTEQFELSAQNVPVKKGKKAPSNNSALSHHGRGEVMPFGEQIWFLPWHGEAIIELTGGGEVSRRLPDKDRPVRAHLLAAEREFQRVARDANVFVQTSQLRANGPYAVDCFGGGRRILAALAFQTQAELFRACCENQDSNEGVLAPGVYFKPRFCHWDSTWHDQPVERDDVLPLFRFLDAHALNLVTTIRAFSSALSGSRTYGDREHPPAISAEVEQVLLHAILETLATGNAPIHTQRLAAWSATKLTSGGIIESLERAGPIDATLPDRNRIERLQQKGQVVLPLQFFETFAKMVVHHLGVVESAPVFEHLFFDHELRFHDTSDGIRAIRRDELWRDVVEPLIRPNTGAISASADVRDRLKLRVAQAAERPSDPEWMGCKQRIADACRR